MMVVAPFVGRTAELGILERELGEARCGRPRVVVVEGVAGAGKSTLLGHFVAGLGDALVLRASCDEGELLLDYGLVAQLLAENGARGRDLSAPPEVRISAGVDPLAAGAELLAMAGRLEHETVVVLEVDDLQWADALSSQALLFALRRLQNDRVLGLVSIRPDELHRLGDGWARFISGDHRASRLRLTGLSADEMVALARSLDGAELSDRAARRLIEHTGGNPLYCRILLEELGAEGLAASDGPLPLPPTLADLLTRRLDSVSDEARELVRAAAVLGRRSALAEAAALADLADPLAALEQAIAAGLLVEEHATGDGEGGPGKIAFSHPLLRRAIYHDLGPTHRRRLHRQAVPLVRARAGLAHRVAAAVGRDEQLADDLEAAAQEPVKLEHPAQAASWLAQAAELSEEPGDRDRRLMDAVELLVQRGDVVRADALLPRLSDVTPGARRDGLLGHLDLLAGRTLPAEARLRRAWELHDPAREGLVGAAAATQLVWVNLIAGRLHDAIVWGQRAVDAADNDTRLRHQALAMLALSLVVDGQGAEGLRRLSFLPAAPAQTPLEETDALVIRGVVRLFTERLAEAIADLQTAASRLRAGVPLFDSSQCLSHLADAEYRAGAWDDAVIHGELAVSLTHDADRAWGLGFVHGYAAFVPAARGDWRVAMAHVESATAAAQALGATTAIVLAATAQAALATARGDPEDVLRAAAIVRAAGHTEVYARPGPYDWLPNEIGAHIALRRWEAAGSALAELEAAISPSSPPWANVTVAHLRGNLAAARGDAASAADAFATAFRRAEGLPLPFRRALLERDDGRRLRPAGKRPQAIARLRSARERLVALGARPYAEACDRELDASGAPVRHGESPGAVGLTPAELAVARLVASGHTNRETADELYLTTKTVEFHLSHIFAKLEVRSRRELGEKLRLGPEPGA